MDSQRSPSLPRRGVVRRVLTSRWLWWPVGGLVSLLALLLVIMLITPTPGALLIRREFDKGSATMRAQGEPFRDPSVTVTRDVQYLPEHSDLAGSSEGDTQFDLYRPPGSDVATPLPVIVWVHGGAWLSGDKTDAEHYYSQLAARGFLVASVNYSLAPEHRYPLAIKQLNEALRYLSTNSARWGIDADRFVLAGDSAGANLASQLAAIVSDESFSRTMGVEPGIAPSALRGAVLNCGVYDAYALGGGDLSRSMASRVLNWGVDNTLWAYTGNRSSPSAARDQMSTILHVTGRYPPTWVSGGNSDPLTAAQSVPFVEKLRASGVQTSTLIYDKTTPADLGHEFQFELGTEYGQRALTETADFVREVTN